MKSRWCCTLSARIVIRDVDGDDFRVVHTRR
jgi:hypothetical protein